MYPAADAPPHRVVGIFLFDNEHARPNWIGAPRSKRALARSLQQGLAQSCCTRWRWQHAKDAWRLPAARTRRHLLLLLLLVLVLVLSCVCPLPMASRSI